MGASSCSLAVPSARKVVQSGDSIGSLPNSSSTLNLTCFFAQGLASCSSIGSCRGHSSVGVGASSQRALLCDLHDLGYRYRSLREWLSHSSAGNDQGGLG